LRTKSKCLKKKTTLKQPWEDGKEGVFSLKQQVRCCLFQYLQSLGKASVMNYGSFWSISALTSVAVALPLASSSGEAVLYIFLDWLMQLT
jgi:hypothetical protein